MGKTIRGFNWQPSEPDYPLPADLPFSVEPTQDNGARALEGRLAVVYGNGDGQPLRDHEYGAAAILANGAVFLPDAAELERLRAALVDAQGTIEAMSGDAADLIDVMDEAAALRTALAHVLVRTHDTGCGTCDAARALLTAEHELPSRAALAPEGSAGTPRGSGPPEKGPYDPDRIRERVARAAERSARDGG